MRGRDYQRARVYRWETERLPRLLPLGASRPLPGWREAQSFVDRVTAAEPMLPVRVDVGAPSRLRGAAGRRRIVLPERARGPDAYCPWYLLHELAHCLVLQQRLPAPGGGHGPHFVAAYLSLLVNHARCQRAWLIGSLKGAKIDFEPSRQEVRS